MLGEYLRSANRSLAGYLRLVLKVLVVQDDNLAGALVLGFLASPTRQADEKDKCMDGAKHIWTFVNYTTKRWGRN